MTKWDDIFIYSEHVGSCLIWKHNRLAGFNNKTINALAGDMAGSLNNQGYWMVYDNTTKKNISCHRVIYEMCYGIINKGLQIDHINGDRADNKLSNLRCVDSKINSRNQKLRKDNSTGVKGVTWNTNKAGNLYAVALWSDLDGKRNFKYFSVLRYGREEALRLSIKCRSENIQRLQDEGAGYSERHIEGECYNDL